MNTFESSSAETSYEEYEGLIKYYEDLDAQERSKEKVEHGPHVKEFEELVAPLLKEEVLEVLNAVKTEVEALFSEERGSAGRALILIVEKMNFLDARTNIPRKNLMGCVKNIKLFLMLWDL